MRLSRFQVVAPIVVFLVVSSGAFFSRSELYATKGTIDVGGVYSRESAWVFLEDGGDLTERLKIKYALESYEGRPLPRVVRVSSSARGKLVYIWVQAVSRDAANAYAEEVMTEIVREHNDLIGAYKANLEKQIEILKELANDVSGGSSSRVLGNREAEVRLEIARLEERISSYAMRPSRILGLVPVGSDDFYRVLLVLLYGAFSALALFFGIYLVRRSIDLKRDV